MITILTATYNREKLLKNLYDSLVRNYNTYKEFEWIVVDDGSNDETGQVINKWKKQSPFPIHYYYQSNQGRMKAINFGITKVTTELTIEVDSDDYLSDDALKTIIQDYKKVKDKKFYALGYIRSMDEYDNQEYNCPKEVTKIFDLYMKHELVGEVGLVFKTDTRRKNEHMLEEGERFITEGRLYNKLDKEYNGIILSNKPIMLSGYQSDGYTKNIDKVFKSNPKGYYNYYLESLQMDLKGVPFNKRLYLIKHLILFACLNKKTKKEVKIDIKRLKMIDKILINILFNIGYKKTNERFSISN